VNSGAMNSSPRIDELKTSDLPAVSAVHIAAFPDSALTKLGSGAVERYYRWQLEGPHECSALGIWTGLGLVGFCFGGIFRGALQGFLKENRAYLAGRILCRPWLLTNSIFRERFNAGWRSLRRRSKKGNRAPKPSIRSFGILSIAVHPDHAGTGFGKMLMAEAERQAVIRGFARMDLSVHPSNVVAVRFYERLGWQRVGTAEKWSGHMIKALNAGADTGT